LSLAGAMAYYILAVSAALVLFTLIMYPIAAGGRGLQLAAFTRAVLPAQAVALSSSSSLASLPALVEASCKLRLPSRIGGFVLPLAVATFKVCTPITWLTGTVFLARLYGISLDTTALVSIALTSILLSATAPGIPQGGVLMLAPVLGNHGIPVEGIALLIAADTIPDLFATMTNVTGDLVAGTVVARRAAIDASDVVAEAPGLTEAET
ncbi:MAG TPA: cation:dicarboxylase symporter family transporter, partial [Gemmatimonadaceae bacterium]